MQRDPRLAILRDSCAFALAMAREAGNERALRGIFIDQMRHALRTEQFDKQAVVDAFAEVAEAHGIGEDALVEACSSSARLEPVDINGFCALDIKHRDMLLRPIIPEKGLAMIFSPRGMGKTRLAIGCGLAVATGTKFLKWDVPKPRKVLLIDGEMPAAALQELLKATLDAATVKPGPGMFQVLAADLLDDGGIGNLVEPKIQAEINALVAAKGTELLLLDNLSSLTAVLKDNDESSWQAMKFWLLGLRRRGVSVLLLHHAGKGGDQRGTSAREDVIDTSISLRHPFDYRPDDGCRFEVHFSKHRGFYGADAQPFEAQQHTTAFGYEWTIRDMAIAHQARVAEMLSLGMSIREIAEEIGISKSTVHRLKQKIEQGSYATN